MKLLILKRAGAMNRFLSSGIVKYGALLLVIVSFFTWLSFSEAVINPQVPPNITVYAPGNLNVPLLTNATAYPYYQGQTLKLDLDINSVLAASSLLPSVVETVYGDLSAVGGPSQFPLAFRQDGLYNLEYPLINLTQTGNFTIPFQGTLSGGGIINLGSFEVYANKQTPVTLTGPEGTKSLKVLPEFNNIENFTAVPGVSFEVPGRGKISLLSPVNLLTGGFMDNLNKLNSGLLLHTPNLVGLNSQLLPGLNVPAKLEIYGVRLAEGIEKPGIIQLDDSGNSVVFPGTPGYHLNPDTLTYDRASGTVSLAVYGFSGYAIDPGLHVNTESRLIEGNSVTIEGYVQDLSTQVAVYVYQENNLAGKPAIDPVTGHFTLELTNLVDGLNPVWVKADNGAVTTTWDAKPASAAIEPLQILVDTNGILEEGISTKDTDIVVETPVSMGVTGRDISTFNQAKTEFYGQAPVGYRATVYYNSQPLATGKAGADGVFLMPTLNLAALPEGNLTFTIKGFNPKGYEGAPVFLTINKDTRPPTDQPLVLDPATDYTTPDPQPTFSGTLPLNTAGDVADVRIYNGSALISVGAVNLAEKTWFVRPALPLTPGDYDFYLILTDRSGNESSATPLPTVHILQPQVRVPAP